MFSSPGASGPRAHASSTRAISSSSAAVSAGVSSSECGVVTGMFCERRLQFTSQRVGRGRAGTECSEFGFRRRLPLGRDRREPAPLRRRLEGEPTPGEGVTDANAGNLLLSPAATLASCSLVNDRGINSRIVDAVAPSVPAPPPIGSLRPNVPYAPADAARVGKIAERHEAETTLEPLSPGRESSTKIAHPPHCLTANCTRRASTRSPQGELGS